MGNLMRFFADPVGALLRLSAQYGDVAALAGGDGAIVCAFGAEHNRAVLSDAVRFENFADVPIPAPPDSAAARFNKNLTNLNGEDHRSRHRRLRPLFTKSAVERYRDAMVAEIERRLPRLRPGTAVDAEAEMMELTLAIVVRCLFGLDVAGEGGALGRLGAESLERLIDPLAMLLPIGLPGTPYRRYLDTWMRLEARIRAIIAERRRGGAQSDVLSLLIQAHDAEGGGAGADDDLIAQAELFFLAGYETTAYTATWTLFLLSQHADALAWLGEELGEKLGGRFPTVEDLASLPRLDAVVKESMRVVPAVPFLFMRRAMEPFTLGGHALPAGAVLCLSPLVTHRAPDLFPDPATFRPQRWGRAAPEPYAYLPFGAGPRLCIGASFAAQSVRLVLASLLQHAWPALLPTANVSRKVRGVTLGLRHGLPMTLVAPGDPPRNKGPVRGDIVDLVQLPG
jgi:cytochrome P450